MTDALILGAGVAGVTAARELSRAGLSVCVVEGRDRIGDRVYSKRDFCECPVEAGAEFVHGVGAATWPRLRASDTGALLWAGSATEGKPIAATVEAAYRSGLRAAREARTLVAGTRSREPLHLLEARRG